LVKRAVDETARYAVFSSLPPRIYSFIQAYQYAYWICCLSLNQLSAVFHDDFGPAVWKQRKEWIFFIWEMGLFFYTIL